jgi:hypothetical protein
MTALKQSLPRINRFKKEKAKKMKASLIRAGIVSLLLTALVAISPSSTFAATASLSLAASTQTVAPGGTFDITVSVNITGGTRSGQCSLVWDPAKIQCNSVEPGTFYSSWASAHSATAMVLPSIPIPIDNTTGKVLMPGFALLGVPGQGPSGQGTFLTFHMAAKAGTSGTTTIHTADVEFSDLSVQVIPGVTVQNDNMQITISSGNTNPVPTIASFTPTSGGNGTQVTITGTNFTGLSGDAAVQFGTTNAASYSVNSATQITAMVPDLGTANTSVNIKVTTAGGTATSGGTFSYTVATTSTTTTTTPTTTTSTTTTSTPTATTSTSTTTTKTTTTPTKATTTTSHTTTTSSPPQTTPKVTTTSTLSAGALDLSDTVDNGGLILDDLSKKILDSSEMTISVNVPINTRALTGEGEPLQSIDTKVTNTTYSAPTGTEIISAFDFTPNGATFSPPITVIFKYNPDQFPKKIDVNKLSLFRFDSEQNDWVKCDYTLDVNSQQLTANISHFSIYAITSDGGSGLMGLGWSMAFYIIIGELLLGTIVIFLFLRRKSPPLTNPVAAEVGVGQTSRSNNTETIERASFRQAVKPAETKTLAWDDIIDGKANPYAPFKTHLEIIGGKIIIPRGGESADIQIINMPDSRIIFSLECDPEKYPKGLAKIAIIGPALEYEKSEEIKK